MSGESLPNLTGLSEAQIKLVGEVADALRQEITSTISDNSDICTAAFVDSLQNRLVLYHALNEQPLTKKTFEYSFARSMRDCGKEAIIVNDPTNPGADVIVGNEEFSLKTEAAQNINPNAITISKLMEARWIRDCLTGQDFLSHVLERVVPHLQKYDRILTLRAFQNDDCIIYHLIEVPVPLLLEVSNLQADSFSSRTVNGSTSADVYQGMKKAFKLSLDGSVEKITIRNLQVALCLRHAEWIVPLKVHQG